MSHVITVEPEIRDLDALQAVCAGRGWKLVRGQKSFKWYGQWVDDYHGEDAAYRSISPSEFGKCEHAIQVPGALYEIGLTATATGYKPVWDNYASGGLQNLTGANGVGGMMQEYSIEKIKREARKQGKTVVETRLPNGSIKLTVRG